MYVLNLVFTQSVNKGSPQKQSINRVLTELLELLEFLSLPLKIRDYIQFCVYILNYVYTYTKYTYIYLKEKHNNPLWHS